MSIITATIWLTVGLSFYDAQPGDVMASGEIYSRTNGAWAAVAVEWVKAGYVHFGDTAHVIFADGRYEKVPVLDVGCHLHWPVWDGLSPSMGADFPNWRDWRQGTPTGTGRLAIQHKDGSWWHPPPLFAWGTKWCAGPLSASMKPTFAQPY